MRPLLAHTMLLKSQLDETSDHGLAAFALSCCQRQFLAYQRAVDGKPWSKREELEALLGRVWAQVERGDLEAPDVNQLLAEAIPPDEPGESVAVALNFVQSIYSIIDFLKGIRAAAGVPAQMALDTCDFLTYLSVDLSPNPDLDVQFDLDPNGLIAMEIDRQRVDWTEIRRPEFSRNDIEGLRQRSRAADVTMGRIFDLSL